MSLTRRSQCLPIIGCIAGNGVEGEFSLYGNGNYTFIGRIVDV